MDSTSNQKAKLLNNAREALMSFAADPRFTVNNWKLIKKNRVVAEMYVEEDYIKVKVYRKKKKREPEVLETSDKETLNTWLSEAMERWL